MAKEYGEEGEGERERETLAFVQLSRERVQTAAPQLWLGRCKHIEQNVWKLGTDQEAENASYSECRVFRSRLPRGFPQSLSRKLRLDYGLEYLLIGVRFPTEPKDLSLSLSPKYAFDIRLGGPQSRFRLFEKRKSLASAANLSPILNRPT
jgi:hypothetical protein